MKKLKRIFFVNSIFFIAINNFIYPINHINSQDLKNSYNESQQYNEGQDSEEDLQKDLYILGPGDLISVNILGTDIEKSNYGILSDGFVSIPLAGDIFLTGKTISQAKKEIIEILKLQIISPEVSIVLIKPRPISVFVLGEVNNPGLYNLSSDKDLNSNSQLYKINTGVAGLPNLISAIKSAGGITPDTKLKEVELVRLLPGNNKEYKKTELNLIDLIFEGKMQNNPYLFDGDIIKFKKANKKLPENISVISSNNLTPSSIKVSVIGEVQKPGLITVDKNTSLFQSILIAGGPVNGRYSSANVDLFRINRNGTGSHKKFKIDFSKGISQENPTLKNGDVVRVRRNLLAKSSDTLGSVTNPLSSVITLYSLFKIVE